MRKQLIKITQIIVLMCLVTGFIVGGCGGGGNDSIVSPQITGNNNSGIVSIPSTTEPVQSVTPMSEQPVEIVTSPATETVEISVENTESETIDPDKPLSDPLIEDTGLIASAISGTSISSATGVSIPYNINGSIDSAGGSKYYRFSLNSSNTVKIVLSFTHSRGDLDLDLLNSSGSRLYYSNGSSNTETINRSLSSGTYYVRVYGYGRALNSYSLSISTNGSSSNPVTPSGGTYDARFSSQSGHPAIAIGQNVLLQIKLVNTGSRTWYKNKVRLATWNSADRNSGFYFSGGRGWLSANRIEMVESSVSPGQTGTFKAEFKATSSSTIKGGTCHKEYFRLVADNDPGFGRFGPDGIFWAITVYNPAPIAITADNREYFGDIGDNGNYFQRYSYNTVAGRTYTIKVTPLNNGNVDLYTHRDSDVSKSKTYGSSFSGGAGQVETVNYNNTVTGKAHIAIYGTGSGVGVKHSYKVQVYEGGNNGGTVTELPSFVKLSAPKTNSIVEPGHQEHCAEYVQRVFAENGKSSIYSDFYAYCAAEWFGKNPSGYTKMSNGSGRSISAGDIICWSGGDGNGHVAIARKIYSNSIEVIEANFSSNNGVSLQTRSISYNSSSGTLSNSGNLTVQGWFRPEGNKSLLYR